MSSASQWKSPKGGCNNDLGETIPPSAGSRSRKGADVNEQLIEIAEAWQVLLIKRAAMEARHGREQKEQAKEESKVQCKLMAILTSRP